MFHKDNPEYNRRQIGFYTLDELVPKDHFLRKVEETIDFSFIYDVVEDSYSSDNGRPSLDPVLLVKIPLIQCFYGIRSMRQTIKDIEVNTAYRWFLGLSLDDKVPHFTTYGKNYSRRFQNKELLAHIFSHVLHHVLEAGLIDPSEIFIDGTHIKAAANNHKYKNVVVNQKAKFMSEQLDVEINLDRKKHAKKFLKPAKKARLNLRNNQRLIQIVVGFTRENTRKSSLIMLRQLVINMVGPWFIQLKQVTSMIVRPFLLFSPS